jgi:hypothetical protein
MNEKEMRKAQEVAVITNQAGWEHVEEFIKKNIKPIEDELDNNFDLKKEEFDALRKEKHAYKSVLNFVNRRVKEVENN